MARLSAAPMAPVGEPAPIRVLVVDGDESFRRSACRILGDRGFLVAAAPDGPSGIDYVRDHEVDVALVDLPLPGAGGIELMTRLQEARPDVVVLLMTAFADVEVTVSAMRAGAFYFFNKPFVSNDAVAAMVDKAGEHGRLMKRTRELQERLAARERFGELIGTSDVMHAVYGLIESVAPTMSTVLLLGESGTGKELVARAIHQRSQRSHLPLVVVNCGAIPRELVEAELFGHTRGAFSGAHAARPGLFESAHGGTLFLDEIADLPHAAQVKLLRALQNGEVRRVGSNETRTVSVRVIAATNVDLAERVAAGSFRPDLFYRLNVIPVVLPPLRKRGTDAILLARHFLGKLARANGWTPRTLSAKAERAIAEYHWPGNVRELEHAMERACVLSKREVIEAWELPFAATTKGVTSLPPAIAPTVVTPGEQLSIPASVITLPYAAAKRRIEAMFSEAYLEEILRRTGGNRALAARQAGMDRANLRRILRRFARRAPG